MSFDDLLKELQGQKTVQEGQISLKDLFNDRFMGKYSTCKSMEEFLEKGNFQVDTLDEMNNIHDELLDRHVARETDFTDWKAMLSKANSEFAAQ
ncbi:hypothetical protein [Paenibacillus sp. MMS18-CY102]|uniref:hypothetical protein n=1 Tax=Paenibacillus sp. MMS18-CY102 TaxID=2682849 RepID=UPI0013656CFA|nr:hypothetical protein [Paenibacillus sp. MMS18-CY102]MWC27731.1 hypothetical protein [Paenibacillus sp. MMS18-CY102]